MKPEDTLVWSTTILEYYERLLRYALRLTNGRREAAEDLVQETALRTLSNPATAGSVTNPGSYLKRVLRNIWIDTWRKEKPDLLESLERDEEDQSGQHAAEPSIEPEILRILENEDYWHELKKSARKILNATEWRILLLHLQGFNCKEIGERTGLSTKAASSALNAIRNKIKYHLRK